MLCFWMVLISTLRNMMFSTRRPMMMTVNRALFTVIIIGLLVENIMFRNVEISTIQKQSIQC